MKKSLDLKTKSLQTLGKQELMGVDGGGWIWTAIAAAIWVYDNWDDIEAGWNSYEPRYMGNE